MDETISTLRIEIGASSDKAVQEVNKVTSALRNARRETNQKFNNPLKSLDGQGFDAAKLSSKLHSIDASDADKAHKKVGALANILNSMKRIAFYRVIRSAIKAVGEAFREGAENAYWYSKTMGDQTKYIAEAYDSLASGGFKMQNQLGAAWATLKATITPILLEIVRLVTMAAQALTQFFAVLGGKGTYLKAIDYSKEWADTTAKGAGAAKEWKNQLMGFDEINRLEEPSSGGGGGGSALPDYENMFEEVDVAPGLQKIANAIKENLPAVEFALGTSLLALGAILTFSGANIPLGLGLMAVGAYTLGKAVKEDWSGISPKVQEAVTEIAVILGASLLAIGGLLAFSGANIPLGIGLMIAGLASFGAVALNWDNLSGEVQRKVTDLGLIVGGSFIALGAIFALSGANIPLGIALMLAGAASMASVSALNWDYVVSLAQGTLGKIMMIVGGALFAVGLILALTGVGIPLGIGLMIAGGSIFGTYTALNWNGLLEKLGKAWDDIKTWFETHVKKYFTKDYWQEKINDMFNISPPHIPMPHFSVAWEDAGPIASFFGFSAIPRIGVQFYAQGGFPEDGLFMANHGELVGQFSNGKTAVANNEQITEGIARAVYEAFIEAFTQTGGDNGSGQAVNIYLDGRQIAQTTTKYQRQFARANG